jgi:pimeloyl-ACP methyl ester carboxylesterase
MLGGLLLAQFGASAGAAGATPAAAEPGPPLTVPADRLARALRCDGPVGPGGRPPVLLLPGAQRTPVNNWEGGYTPALAAAGRVACTVPLVADGAGDIQESAEYVVHAVRELARRSGRRIAIVGHSQGGFAAVWALRVWPDLASQVADVVTFGSAFQGVAVARHTCDLRPSCEPGSWQVATGSRFVAALNRGDPTPAETDYTVIYSTTDEFAAPDARRATRLDGAALIGVQEACPGRPVEHLQLSDDGPTFAIVLDALDHPGPAALARIPAAVCATATPPGFDLPRRAVALTDRGGDGGPPPATPAEPPLRS